MKKYKDLDANKLRKILHYDAVTGIFTWLERGTITFDRRFAGKRAGNIQIDTKGYKSRNIGYGGKLYKEHRLAMLYMNGCLPDMLVDHINRDATDNRFCNLRMTTISGNHKNVTMLKNNTSGATGVVWDKESNRWRAAYKVDGKNKHIGRFNTIAEASRAVMSARAGDGFHLGHGTPICP